MTKFGTLLNINYNIIKVIFVILYYCRQPSNMALSGHTLRVALDTWEPYVYFPEEAEQDYSQISGLAFDTFKVIAQKLNVS